jgi:3-oxoacyl-[acyl-carrier-protein] synthase III
VGFCELPYEVSGISARIGQVLDVADWARWAGIPRRNSPGETLDGDFIAGLLGVRSKSWSPRVFRDPDTVAQVAQAALDSAGLRAADVDFAVFVTCTPFELQMDQDAFRVLDALGVSSDIVPIVLGAGCAGLARAMKLLSRVPARHALLISYNAVSPYMADPESGESNLIYRENDAHPAGDLLWFSPALFSDGAAAMVLSATESAGSSLYVRGAGEADYGRPIQTSLVCYPGGGALHPPGFAHSDALSAFALVAEEVNRYYPVGMRLNHRALCAERPSYVDEVARIYTHQAGPDLVTNLVKALGLPAHKVPTHAERLGNLVSPCTAVLLNEDLCAGRVQTGDEVCVSVVGAGPERGAFLVRVNLRGDVRPAEDWPV